MEIEVYCDESGLEALANKEKGDVEYILNSPDFERTEIFFGEIKA